ncbi:MAG: restriction endonuclease subunit S [Polyangiaceae bacterium]
MGGEQSWRRIPFGDIATVRSGYAFKSSQWQQSGVPVVKIGNVKAGRLDMEGCSYVSSADAETSRFLLSRGDILVGLTGYVGDSAVVRDEAPLVLNQRVGLVKPRAGIESRFVYYVLSDPEFRAAIERASHGSAQANVSPGSIEKIPVLLPSVDDQRAIAHILGTLDDKIELNRRMNETLEAMARALFKSWFVDFDPVRAKAEGQTPPGMDPATAALFPGEFQDSELGEIPKGWTSLPLYDAATYVNGAAYRAFQPNGDRRGLPIIKIAELKAGVTEQTKYSDVQMPEKYRLKTGDILFSWSGNPDTSIDTFVWSHGPAWLNQHIFRVDPHQPEERTFALATLKYLRPVFAEIARNKQTTGLGHVTAGDMKRLLIVKPDERILKAWNANANPLFDAVFRNTLEAQTLAKTRDTLLPRLLSGELSVAEAEPAVEATA